MTKKPKKQGKKKPKKQPKKGISPKSVKPLQKQIKQKNDILGKAAKQIEKAIKGLKKAKKDVTKEKKKKAKPIPKPDTGTD